jgi:hypothetical protein
VCQIPATLQTQQHTPFHCLPPPPVILSEAEGSAMLKPPGSFGFTQNDRQLPIFMDNATADLLFSNAERAETMIKFNVKHYAQHVASFEELVERTVFNDRYAVIIDALGFHKRYKDEILEKNKGLDPEMQRVMVLFHDTENFQSIDDERTDEHFQVDELDFGLPESALAGISEDFNPASFSEEISRSLIFYDHLIHYMGQGMHLGIWDAASEKLTILTPPHVSAKMAGPVTSGFLSPSGPVLH